MDASKLCSAIKKATDDLSPISVSVIDANERTGTVRILAEAFSGMKLSERTRTTLNLIKTYDKSILKNYDLAFELLSLDDFAYPSVVYLASRVTPNGTNIIGAYTTFEKAKAGIHRYMNKFGLSLKDYKWEKEMRRYVHWKDPSTLNCVFHISRQKVDTE